MRRVALVGCGRAGRKRIAQLVECQLVACCDPLPDRARAVAQTGSDVVVEPDWRNVVERTDVDIVFVSTPHHLLAEVSLAAVRSGKHVLVEKPAGVNEPQIDEIMAAAERAKVLVRVGFNHRYHSALRQAKAMCDANVIGDLMYVRGRYGHGGYPEFDRQWRARRELSGGGSLIDQGIHLIDLSRWFLGDFTHVQSSCQTYFWNMDVEDNAFLILTSKTGRVAFLHASSTLWRPTFELEICGELGKLEVSGLGGKYGTERLLHQEGSSPGRAGAPVESEFLDDRSWESELREFLLDIQIGRTPAPGLQDAKAALHIVEYAYDLMRIEPQEPVPPTPLIQS